MKIFQAIFLKNNGKTAGSVGFKDQEELIQRLELDILVPVFRGKHSKPEISRQ